MLRLISYLFAAAVLFLSAPAWTEEVTDRDRFKLLNNCGPMQLVVEALPKSAADIGLTEETLETSVRSRLRAARIYNFTSEPYLYVDVNVSSRAFNIRLSYKKVLLDVVSAESGYAVTWTSGGTGTHGQDSNFIISSVSQYTDKFIDEYLRVNEELCGR